MRVQIAKGETLLDALRRGQIHMDAACNGKGSCGLCLAEVYGYGRVKSCQFDKAGIFEVTLPKEEEIQGIIGQGQKTGESNTLEEHKWANLPEDTIILDLGTTTVAMVGRIRGRLFETSFVNPQRAYGADVLSRIKASNEGKTQELCQLIWKEIENKIKENIEEDEIRSHELKMIVSANTTMEHLLMGLSTEGLGKAPFIPVDISLHTAKHVDKDRAISCQVTYLPGISTFVGADIVSGLLALEVCKEAELMLFLDLGTNGEMALGNKEKLLVASTSAGPAFEAGPLAMKLHASGLMEILHKLLDQGIMGDTGLLMEPYFTEGYPVEEFLKKEEQEEKAEAGALSLSQDLVRELQMAKGAIRAGIEILLKEYGVCVKDIKKVYLAGGMGYYINPEDAAAIGLIPEELLGKCQAVGNSSLRGAYLYAGQTSEAKENLQKILSIAEEVSLASHKDFEGYYIKHINF